MPIQIANLELSSPILLAPMAGVADLPMREMARRWGAGLAYAEMLTSDMRLWGTDKSSRRLPNQSEPSPRPIQIAGYDPEMMAEAARRCQDLGAGLIDINMGCPAKKVCKRAAGSALLSDEPRVARILEAVVQACEVPVTLKMRTGIDPENRNATRIARIASESGIAALTVHGRTRACRFRGQAEYKTIAEVAEAVDIPVFANGDIGNPTQAAHIMSTTGAAGVMIGRAALGQPWIFHRINTYLRTNQDPGEPDVSTRIEDALVHLRAIHEHYPGIQGVRIARKHIGWYLEKLLPESQPEGARRCFNAIEEPGAQRAALQAILGGAPPLEAAA